MDLELLNRCIQTHMRVLEEVKLGKFRSAMQLGINVYIYYEFRNIRYGYTDTREYYKSRLRKVELCNTVGYEITNRKDIKYGHSDTQGFYNCQITEVSI